MLDVGILNITNRVGQTVHECGHAFIAFSTCTDGPVNGCALTHFRFPLGMNAAEVVGEVKGGARAICATHDCDFSVRQRQSGVQGLDGGIVPFGDLAEVNITQHLAVKFHLARSDTFDVDDRHGATDDGGELKLPLLLQIFVSQRHVGGTKVHRFGIDLLDASTRTYGLVVDFDACGLVVVCRPFGIQRSGEAGAGTGHLLRAGQRSERQGNHTCQSGQCEVESSFHG